MEEQNGVNSREELPQYEVVRQDYFFSQEEPQFTFHRGKAHINSAGLRLFPGKDYIQILIDKKEKIMIIKPYEEKVKDSFKWSAGRKRQPRHMRCVPLYYMVYQMMGWNLNARYRITGFKQEYGNGTVLFFRLSEAICYVKDDAVDENGAPVIQELFPKEWETKFGIAEAEHKESDVVKIYEEDGLFEIRLPINEGNLARMTARTAETAGEGCDVPNAETKERNE